MHLQLGLLVLLLMSDTAIVAENKLMNIGVFFFSLKSFSSNFS